MVDYKILNVYNAMIQFLIKRNGSNYTNPCILVMKRSFGDCPRTNMYNKRYPSEKTEKLSDYQQCLMTLVCKIKELEKKLMN